MVFYIFSLFSIYFHGFLYMFIISIYFHGFLYIFMVFYIFLDKDKGDDTLLDVLGLMKRRSLTTSKL